jgi:hypothetical protein
MTRPLLRVLAFICSVCPICIARRRWPGSLFGRTTARIERFCPFCSAYWKLHRQDGSPRGRRGGGLQEPIVPSDHRRDEHAGEKGPR